MRDLAFVHVDTNGPEPGYHRIHWIGVVRCRAEDLKEVDRRSIGVGWRLPYWPEDADELLGALDPAVRFDLTVPLDQGTGEARFQALVVTNSQIPCSGLDPERCARLKRV